MSASSNRSRKPKQDRGVAEAIDPSLEDDYWRENYSSRPYVKPGADYDAYRPAYRHGWQARGRYGELNWEGVEPKLEERWPQERGESPLTWEEARAATRDAWERIRPGVDYRAENR